MMRWFMALLLILNAATLAWQWDAFARWGWGPNTAREPERLASQIRPEALKIETPAAAAERMAAETAAAASTPASKAPMAAGSTPSENGRPVNAPAPDGGKAIKATNP